jgi:hypothetical protein
MLLFEPWNLGDAIIAASVARTDPDHLTLACNSRWHEVLTLASKGSLKLLSLDLPYVWRTNKKFFSLGDAAASAAEFRSKSHQKIKIISIRGDTRDWIAAHRLFPCADFKFSGLLPFSARKSSLFDLPFKYGYLAVRNRYRAWAEAADIPFNVIKSAYSHSERRDDAPVVIHVGAQWRSKQYPHVAELVRLLNGTGNHVEILAGPDDPLPPDISADMVQRPQWPGLAAQLRTARYVICNDSGPMHLAAYLGCRTISLSRCANILEWLPPGVTAISSPSAPIGYRPVPDYWSDRILTDWTAPDEIIAYLKAEDSHERNHFKP